MKSASAFVLSLVFSAATAAIPQTSFTQGDGVRRPPVASDHKKLRLNNQIQRSTQPDAGIGDTQSLTASGAATSTTKIVTTIAGLTRSVYGNGGAAIAAYLANPNGIAIDAAGNIYVADEIDCQIRKVVAGTGAITAFAGTGQCGYSGDGQLAVNAQIDYPGRITNDSTGNLFISDEGNSVVREVNAITGIITTVAGIPGSFGYSGDGGAATSAKLNNPNGVAFDSAGNLYIADSYNFVVRKVTKSTGIITTVAGTPGDYGYSGDGSLATQAELSDPNGVAVDASGNLYIADTGNSIIRKVASSTGKISTYAGDGNYGYSGDGGAASNAELTDPDGIGLDTAGNLYIADRNNAAIRKVTASTGIISTVVGNGVPGYSGDGGVATEAQISVPRDVRADASGNLLIADCNNDRLRMVNTEGVISTIAGVGLISPVDNGASALTAPLYTYPPETVVADASGNIEFADSGNNMIREVTTVTGKISTLAGDGKEGYTGDGGPATAAELDNPSGIVFDSQGNLYIADTYNYVVRKVTKSTGVITTFAGNGTYGNSGDGGLATDAQLSVPLAVAIDATGNVYIADTYASVVRKVTPAGIISTVAGQAFTPWFGDGSNGDGGQATSAELGYPDALAVNANGSLFIGDQVNAVVRKVSAASGIITTVAGDETYGYSGDGGMATSASIGDVYGLAFDRAGNLYLADYQSVRIVNASGVIESVAGQGGFGYAGDGGPAASALVSPGGLAVDSASNIYFADIEGNRIRKISTGAVQVAAATPVLSPVAGSYGAGQSVSISDATTGAEIFYTLDGSVPNPGTSSLYAGPLTLFGNITVSAIAIAPGYSTSATAAASYTFPAVGSITTTTKLAASPNPSNSGLAVTFTATVTEASGPTPTGTVTFEHGATVIGTGTLSGGVATLNYSGLTVGSHSITATYSGSAVDAASTSPALLQVVNPPLIATTTKLAASPNPSASGQAVTFTATVTPASGSAPTGTVTFMHGATMIGTGTLSGGVAKLIYSGLTVGSHSVTATYGGSSTDATSTSAALLQVVNAPLIMTTAALTSSPNPSTLGQPVTFRAAVTAASGPAPTGTVTFMHGGTVIGTATLSGGVASLAYSGLTAGSHSMTATYGGSSTDATSTSAAISQVVNQ